MTVSLVLGLALAAGAPEPVVWTKMADPDPTYVAPKASASPSRKPAKPGAKRGSEPDNMDGAVVNLLQAAVEAERKLEQEYEREVRRIESLVERAERAGLAGEAPDEAEPPQR